MGITLYHVSFNLDEPLHKEFIPKIPSNTVNGENKSISRICFSDSICGCIRAINGYSRTEEDAHCLEVYRDILESNKSYELQGIPDYDLTDMIVSCCCEKISDNEI